MKTCTIVNIDRCSLNDGPGIRTVIFFKGCCLRCIWCHNPETYRFDIQEYEEDGRKKTYGKIVETDEIKRIILKDMKYYHKTNGGVTLSGGEALLQIDAAYELAKFCKDEKLSLCVETSGAVPLEYIKKIEEYVDYWLYDYKLSDQEKYYDYLKTNSSLILDNLKYLIDNKRHIILRCPIIHKINDNMDHFQAISHYSKYVSSIEILPYHNLGKAKAENINLDSYFYQENTSEELKELWKKQLSELGCLNFKIH